MEQCEHYDGTKFNGLGNDAKWTAKYVTGDALGSGWLDERCKLYCSVSNTQTYYKMQEKVIDGTTCDPYTNDICVNGVCQPAGCDHTLGSTSKPGEWSGRAAGGSWWQRRGARRSAWPACWLGCLPSDRRALGRLQACPSPDAALCLACLRSVRALQRRQLDVRADVGLVQRYSRRLP